MNPVPNRSMKTTIQRLSISVLLTTTTVTLNAGDLHVPADYATIQAAVNAAASGDTIHIAAGVYTEQVRIVQKNLTLLGQPGTILRATPGMEAAIPGGYLWRCVVFIHLATNVVLRDLSFEGDHLADQQEHGMRGVEYLDSGGTVENCRFTGFREAGPVVERVGGALAVFHDLPGAPLYDFRVAGNTIVDCYSGVYMVGAPDQVSLNVTIENNIVHGVGPTAASSSDGVSFAGFTLSEGMTATVTGNTVTGFSYSGEETAVPPIFHFGILVRGGGLPDFIPVDLMRFEDNEFQDNDVHLSLLKADQHKVLNNRFAGTGSSQRHGGVVLSGTDVLVKGNTFRDMPEGIIVLGDDPDFGLIVGVATNAMLIDNRFCNVATNVWLQPLATATEIGTLECPFPDPTLMLLSWPGIEAGFSVQSAPTPSGPWTPLEATPIRQNGENRVVVPAAGEQQFFRLAKP